MLSAAMTSPSFHRAGGKATYEVPATEQIDQQGGQGCDDHSGTLHTMLRDIRDGGGERDESGRDGLLLAGRERHAIEELVPDMRELPDHGDDQDGRRERQDDAPENAKEPGAVDARGPDQFMWNGDIVV